MIDAVTSDAAIERIKRDISNCRLKGLMVEPFVAGPAMDMVPIIGTHAPDGRPVPTAAVSGRRLYVNPEFWNGLIKAERIGLFMHEVWHIALCHHLRRGERNPKLWNIACDYVINLLVTQAGFDLPKGGLLDQQYVGWSEERVYQHLWDNALVIQMPSNATQHMSDDDQQDDGGSTTVIVEGEKPDDGSGSDGTDPDQPDNTDGDQDKEKGECSSEQKGSDSEGDGAHGEDDEESGQGDSSDKAEGGESGDTDGSGPDGGEGSDSGGEEKEGDDGHESDSQEEGQDDGDSVRPAEPDAPKDEAAVVKSHADAYEDVPWGEVWDAEDEDGDKLTPQEAKEEMHRLKEDLQMSKNMNHVDAGSSGRTSARRAVENLVAPQTDWSHQIRMFFSKNGNVSGRAWSSLDRRGLQVGRYEPAEIKESIDWIVCFWDVSISMDWPSHRALLSQLSRIRKTTIVNRMTILPFNGRALTDDIVELKPRDHLPKEFNIGGGTSFNAPFQWLAEQQGEPDGVLVFTDLGSTVTVPKPRSSVLWVSSEPVYAPGDHPYADADYTNRPPWGKVIQIKVN